MDVEYPSSAKFPSTEVSNFWLFLLTLGYVDFRVLRTSNLPLCPLVGGKLIPPIITGELPQEGLTEISYSPGVVLSLTVRITWPGVQIARALLYAASLMTSVV